MADGLPSWGEEVLPGVHLFRRTHNPHVALAKRAHDAMLSGAPVEMSINYEKIHEDLDSMKEMIERLEESNRFMREYLAEANDGGADDDDDEVGTIKTADIHAEDDNECVREALRENETLIKEKKKQLGDLLELTRLHYCSHDHNRLSDAHGCCEASPAVPLLPEADENSGESAAAESNDAAIAGTDDDVDSAAEKEEVGECVDDVGFDDDNTGGMCMGDLIAQRRQPPPQEPAPASTGEVGAFYL